MAYVPMKFTKEQAQAFANRGSKSGKFFYVNVFGWETYYTRKPTFATPTGKAKGFPRRVLFRNETF
jgi:hypothetical protein